MAVQQAYEVIIVGGSFAGLSAAMALGRSLRKVLVIDCGTPCNKQAPFSHNFITHDGVNPALLLQKAKEEVLAYPSVTWLHDKVIDGSSSESAFTLHTEHSGSYMATKLLFATGIRDIMPDIEGFDQCWGISAIHCPYCHGYEVKGQAIGILGNGDTGFQFAKFLHHWSQNICVLCDGPSAFSIEQKQLLEKYNINIIEKELGAVVHENGQMRQLRFHDQSLLDLDAIFTRPAFEQHSKIPHALGCALTDNGLIKVDQHQRTSVPGIFAAGDNSHFFRALSVATAAGTIAGASINWELINSSFGD